MGLINVSMIGYCTRHNISLPNPFQVDLEHHQRLLQGENLTLEAEVAMKTLRLSLVREDNLKLHSLLREREYYRIC